MNKLNTWLERQHLRIFGETREEAAVLAVFAFILGYMLAR